MRQTYPITFLFFFISISLFSQPSFPEADINIPGVEDSIRKFVKGNLGVDIEQDWFVDWMPNKNFDRNYTQGTAFSYSHPELNSSILFIPMNLLERLNERIHPESECIHYPSTLSMGVTAFTPRIIDSPEPVVGDRPFAGMVALTTTQHKYNLKTKTIIQTSLNFGLLGTNITNSFQSFAHQHIIKGRPTNISWHHQISEGGSFAFLFTHKVNRSVLTIPYCNKTSGRSWFDASLGYKLDIGWYTGIALLSMIKIGILSSYSLKSTSIDNVLTGYNKVIGEKEKYNLSHTDDSLQKLNLSFSETKKIEKTIARNQKEIILYKKSQERKIWDIYLFASMNPRLTPYNSLLLGQPHKESLYTLDFEDYNPFLTDYEYGLVISRLVIRDAVPIPVKRFDIVLSINHRSPEIRNEEYHRWHHWGRISLRFPLF